MPITVEEKFKSREGTPESLDRVYLVSGTDSDIDARDAAVGVAPVLHGTAFRQADKARAEQLNGVMWLVRVPYSNRVTNSPPQEGELVFSFDTEGGSLHIAGSKTTVAAYGTGATTSDNGNLIGVTDDSVEGVDIETSGFNFTISRMIAADDVTATYLRNLFDLTQKVNSGSYAVTIDGETFTFAAGEVRFRGATGTWRVGQPMELVQKFNASPNATGLQIGSISGIAKKGQEYLWVRYEPYAIPGLKVMGRRPKAVYVEKVYDTADLSALDP